MIADYERNNFSISQCDWNTTSQPRIVAIRRPSKGAQSQAHHLSAGAIVGIAIGGLVAFIVIMAGSILYLKRRRRPAQNGLALKKSEMTVPELASGNDPYALVSQDKDKEMPHSPELDGAIHKGHELEVSPQLVQHSPYELDADSRRSLTLTPSEPPKNARTVNQRHQSDPASFSSVGSLNGRERDCYFGQISPDLDRSSLFAQAPKGVASNSNPV